MTSYRSFSAQELRVLAKIRLQRASATVDSISGKRVRVRQCACSHSVTLILPTRYVDAEADIQFENFLFRSKIRLTARELSAFSHFNTFVLKVYVKAWFTWHVLHLLQG